MVFEKELERYLCKSLHIEVWVDAIGCPGELPAFFGQIYEFYEVELWGKRCVIFAAKGEVPTPAQVAKHLEVIGVGVPAIFAAAAMTAYNRARLVEKGVPFIVPGNQLYLPMLAIDLREHFRVEKRERVDKLPPVAQVVLFAHMLRLDAGATTPSELAKCVGYTAMSIGRAFDALEGRGLACTEKRGKERHILFELDRKALLDAALPYLQNPIRSVKFVRGQLLEQFAGESALAELTQLAHPQIPTYAVTSAKWQEIAPHVLLIDKDEADCTIEVWSYDPSTLSHRHVVDPLSLYVQFRDHPDERLVMAAEVLYQTF